LIPLHRQWGFGIVFPEVSSGSSRGILADLALMQNAPLNRDRGASETSSQDASCVAVPYQKPQEIGGPVGLEPTRFGDWERKGRCIDF
jgi:hypothetical protein